LIKKLFFNIIEIYTNITEADDYGMNARKE